MILIKSDMIDTYYTRKQPCTVSCIPCTTVQ